VYKHTMYVSSICWLALHITYTTYVHMYLLCLFGNMYSVKKLLTHPSYLLCLGPDGDGGKEEVGGGANFDRQHH
jgi:hypothetical protein